MSQNQPTVDWAARIAALAELDGEEWKEAEAQFRSDWLAAYRAAFVEIAVANGWTQEDAETWPAEIGLDAYIQAPDYDWCPRRTAEANVIMCEEPL